MSKLNHLGNSMQTELINIAQKKIGDVQLNDSIFTTKELPYLWHEMTKWQLAKKRQGTAKTKQRHEVSGSTRKIYRQKGTGRARHGSVKSPVFVGGGQTFGPIPRSYEYVIPKKMKKKALRSALSMKVNHKMLKVVDSLTLEQAKTKQAVALLDAFNFKSAVVIDAVNDNLKRATRNLRSYKFLQPAGLNVYDLMKFEGVIITQGALQSIEESLSL